MSGNILSMYSEIEELGGLLHSFDLWLNFIWLKLQ